MSTITRRLEWDAGHRVLGHEGKCRHIHGHRYVAEVTVEAPKLDSIGRVVDFSVIKERYGDWIESNWDHNLLLHPQDPLRRLWIHNNAASQEIFGGKAPYIMAHGNPTAENIAEVLYRLGAALLPANIEVSQVRVYETPNCWADCYGPSEGEVQ